MTNTFFADRAGYRAYLARFLRYFSGLDAGIGATTGAFGCAMAVGLSG